MHQLGFSKLLISLIFTIAINKNSFASPEKPQPRLLPVPIIRQSTPYSCGAAALHAVMQYWQISSEGELALHEPLQTDKEQGTHPLSLFKFANTLGLKAELRTQTNLVDIEAAIDRKEPVIVDYQAWGAPENKDYSNVWDSGHYGVVVGYDATFLYLMDPFINASYGKIEKSDFRNRWHDVETRNGTVEYFIQSAIFISGVTPLKSFPSQIQPID